MRNTLSNIPASQIIELLEEHSGSQRTVAKILGVNQSSVSRWIQRYQDKASQAIAEDADLQGIQGIQEIHEYFRDVSPADVFVDRELEDAKKLPEKAVNKSAKKFVITSAVNATPVHPGFWKALQRYAAYNHAELLVVPIRYRNPTSIWTSKQDRDDWWAKEVAGNICNSRVTLGKNLVLLGDIKVQPTSSAPLSGLGSITGGASAILGHPNVARDAIAAPQNTMAKILVSTGAVTLPNYAKTKAGSKGEFNHSLGACVVEIVGDKFHVRQILADEKDGSFDDLEMSYSATKTGMNGGVAALVMGDAHVDFIADDVVSATFKGTQSMMHRLKPAMLVLHDVLDCYSISHHHEHDPLIKYVKHHSGRNDAAAEIKRAFAFIDQHTLHLDTKVVVVGSNHNDHLGQWLRACDPRKDPQNAVLWSELWSAMCLNSLMAPGGADTIDPLQYLAIEKGWLLNSENTIWPARDESFAIHGIELGMHGDKGSGGSRGSAKGLSNLACKSVIGHSHTPRIVGGCYQVGTSSRFDLEYTKGSPSSWLHTHCIIYKTGKRTLVDIIDGEWCAPF